MFVQQALLPTELTAPAPGLNCLLNSSLVVLRCLKAGNSEHLLNSTLEIAMYLHQPGPTPDDGVEISRVWDLNGGVQISFSAAFYSCSQVDSNV